MQTATLPIIALTAQSGESEEKALDLGAHDDLTKPLQTGSLLARVRPSSADQHLIAQLLAD